MRFRFLIRNLLVLLAVIFSVQATSRTDESPKSIAVEKKTKAAKKRIAKRLVTAKPKPATKKPATSGANPRVGKLVATIWNGNKGDTLTFRVSADGKQVIKVKFKGSWSKRDGDEVKVLRNLDPPAPFTISAGKFSGTQNVAKSRMWWEFMGRFKTPTAAEGSYRCVYARSEKDTYNLKWTARYVSP